MLRKIKFVLGKEWYDTQWCSDVNIFSVGAVFGLESTDHTQFILSQNSSSVDHLTSFNSQKSSIFTSIFIFYPNEWEPNFELRNQIYKSTIHQVMGLPSVGPEHSKTRLHLFEWGEQRAKNVIVNVCVLSGEHWCYQDCITFFYALRLP